MPGGGDGRDSSEVEVAVTPPKGAAEEAAGPGWAGAKNGHGSGGGGRVALSRKKRQSHVNALLTVAKMVTRIRKHYHPTS